MEIVTENIETFIKGNSFDFYIVDEFSRVFAPENSTTFVVKDFAAENLRDLVNIYSPHYVELVAIGAGGVLDPAKYLASRFEKRLTVIPTALSTNSFATNRSSFLKGDAKVSMTTKAPDRVVLDMGTLSKAGILNSFGLIELAATATAQVDWGIAVEAEREDDNKAIRERSEKLVRSTIELLKSPTNLPKRLSDLLENLIESGKLTISFGTGRPVSGTEHIISAYIENQLHCPHGVGLYVGIQIANKLHRIRNVSNSSSDNICASLEQYFEIREYVRKFLPEEQVRNSLAQLRTREGRYTVLDIVAQEELDQAINSVCDKIYKI